MEAKKMGLVRDVVAETVSKLSDQEKSVVIDWAEYSKGVLTDDSISKKEKLIKLREVSTAKPVIALLMALARLLKSKTWDEQSWARRLGIAGLATGLLAFGWEGAGIAALGGAIGVPLALLTATGTTVLGVVIDELRKDAKGKRSE